MTPSVCKHRGFVLMLVLAVSVILLLLGVTLHSFVTQQNANLHLTANAEIAHFLAEAGISSSIRAVRETLAGIAGSDGGAINSLLQKPTPLPDMSLMPYMKDTWNEDLKKFATEVDPTASIRVEVWLRGFRQTETDPSAWVDPGAKTGYLAVEATGEYRGMKRTLSVRRPVRVGSSLPPVVSKFTLHVRDAARGSKNRFNLMLNDYDGINGDPKPLIVMNHATPESPLEPKAQATILTAEKDEQIFEKRGWIWLGGGDIRLNLTSGPGPIGEIFHFYEVDTATKFDAVKFKKAVESLPPAFAAPLSPISWDRISPPRDVSYAFGYSYILAGFHDKSGGMDHDAMFLGGIISSQEKSEFSAKSSILHLFGESRKGFQSRTRVFGSVTEAFPRYASLDVTAQESDVKTIMDSCNPPPTYLLPSLSASAFVPTYLIRDVQKRRTGGPLLPLGVLFQDYDAYKNCMSSVLELPYVNSYNTLQEILTPIGKRKFPPAKEILKQDLGQPIEIKRGSETLYKGSVDATRIQTIAESRVMHEYPDLNEFWKAFPDPKNFRLNQIVRIVNAEKRDLILPPLDVATPLSVAGGGMIILEDGNVVLRGVVMQSPTEALTVIAPRASSVRVDTDKPDHINIYAPQAQFSASARIDLLGTLAVGGLDADPRSQGGILRYREAQDPTASGYFAFYKSCIDDKDTSWHE
ncbi:MAG: hypothetical protein HQM09_00285 [Candidatus Riflebacteria bacterium]|nr:hypothetical protein [Candidatus Riflebacteria bacterium]